jgi:hypothetical protein
MEPRICVNSPATSNQRQETQYVHCQMLMAYLVIDSLRPDKCVLLIRVKNEPNSMELKRAVR